MRFSNALRLVTLMSALMPTPLSHATFPPHAPRGWWFKVHDADTESSGFQIKVQLGGNGVRDTAPWTDPITWRKGDALEFGLPDNRQDLWYARKVHLFARSMDDDNNVCVALYYNDTQVKLMTFDSDGWDDEEQEWCRPDDKDCPVDPNTKC